MLLTERSSAFHSAHLSLAIAGMMWVFPFLIFYHNYPLTAFYQEWLTALLGLLAVTSLVSGSYWRRAEVPRIVLLPVLLMLLVLSQFVLGRLPYFGQALLYALYLIWAALLMLLGAHLREELGLAAVATVLAGFSLIGAELNAILGILQHFGWHTFLDHVLTAKVSAAVYGNIAQPNHYADYLLLGLVSLGGLYAAGRLRWWQAVLLALPILFTLPLSGSRETWICLAWLVLLAFWWWRRDRQAASLLGYALLILIGFALMHWVVQLPWMVGASGSVNSVQRLLAEDVHSGGIRLYLWHEAWLIFLRFPLLGAGFGQFAWQHFQLAPLLHDTQISGLYNNAHNLIMQMAAEGGAVGVLILLATLASWLWQQRRAELTVYQWWACAMLGVLATHSLLEYPLWYAYFIGIAAILLGALDMGRYRLELKLAGRSFMVLAIVLGLSALWQLLSGYRDVERLLSQHPHPGNEAAYYSSVQSGFARMQQQALLQPYADLFSSSMLAVSEENLAGRLALNDRAIRFIPVATGVYRQALLLAMSGDGAAAQAQLERAIWAYPTGFGAAEQELRELSSKDPARFATLLEFGIQKYEEYQRELHAVPAK